VEKLAAPAVGRATGAVLGQLPTVSGRLDPAAPFATPPTGPPRAWAADTAERETTAAAGKGAAR
jgi:hypothetical protein